MEAELNIEKNISNEVVAEIADGVIRKILSVTNNVAVIIGSDGKVKVIGRERNGEMPAIELQDDSTIMNTTLREEANTNEHASQLIVEWVMDMWLKYGITYFYAEYDQPKSELRFFWNKSIDESFIQSYWVQNDSDGWNTEGVFWKREWMKQEHKHNPATGKTGKGGDNQ